ncbi:MAG: T9SS type A sorting domain-containing protein, partial [Ignavibacteriaceae bacterium]|nr:T9SS type A sorting domain-containing protein [Ignavibacteriaceae bacterium]
RWTAVNNGLKSTDFSSFAVYPNGTKGSNIFAASNTFNKVFLSTNDGASWTEVDSGLTLEHEFKLIISNNYLFAGSVDGTIWKRPLSEMISGTAELNYIIPNSFSLKQNYPNPFNPSTVISYAIPKASLVTIKVYDVLGKEIRSLVNEEKSAGNYSIQFNGDNLASGIYFYQMKSENFVQTRKLILMK